MDSAPHRRDPAAVLTPDFDATDADPDAAYPRVPAVADDPGEAAWRGDEWCGNQFAEAAWLDAAGPGEGGRRSVSVGYDGGCIGLWRAVVWQAFLDATAFGNEEIPGWARPKVGEPARRAARAPVLKPRCAKRRARKTVKGLTARCALLMPVLLSASCAEKIPAIDSCAWVKEIRTTDAIVRGSQQFEILTATDPRELASSGRDILSPATAGQIVAHNRKRRQNCGD